MGVGAVRRSGKWGYIDERGSVVIPFRFDGMAAGSFVGGLARAAPGKQWGFIDSSGEFVIPPTFEKAYDFSDGLAEVVMGGLSDI